MIEVRAVFTGTTRLRMLRTSFRDSPACSQELPMQAHDLEQLADMVAQRMRSVTSAARLRGQRKPHRVPDYLTEDEIAQLLRVISKARDKAIFVVTYYRGLRASELGMIDVDDYHPASGRLTIRRLKGSRGGEYYVTEAERSALTAWLNERGAAPGPLFISRNRRGISRFRPPLPPDAEILRCCRDPRPKSAYARTEALLRHTPIRHRAGHCRHPGSSGTQEHPEHDEIYPNLRPAAQRVL